MAAELVARQVAAIAAVGGEPSGLAAKGGDCHDTNSLYPWWRCSCGRLPFGTQIRVCHSGCVTVRINDRGPRVRGRDIDLTLIVSWVVGLQGIDAGEYVYGVTNLDLTYGNAPTVLVRISRSFDAWQVTRIQ
jgi:hypothetical protein